jgi:hypothetical protein
VRTGRKVCETAHLLAAGLWLGTLVMAGVTAAVMFTSMRTLEPELGRFAAYTGDQSNLGAGFLQNRIFLAGDVIQFVCATLVLATTIAMLAFFGLPLRRISSAVRLFALGAVMILASYQLFVLSPRMQTNVERYWQAAEAGENDAAESARLAFSADHPTASRVLGATALSVAILLAAGAWSAASAAQPERAPRPASRSGLEEPGLARGKGVRRS